MTRPPVCATQRLFVLDDAPIVGGAELFAMRLGSWLTTPPNDWHVTIVCPDPGPFAERARTAGLEVHGARFPDFAPTSAPRWPGAMRDMARMLRAARGDGSLVVANTARAQAYAAAARPCVRNPPPVVNLVHEQDTAARRSARAVLGRVGRVVAVGANAAAAYERALPGQRIGRLNNFLDPVALDRAVAQRVPRTSDHLPALGVLARLIPEKGLLELVEELAMRPEGWSALRVGGGAQDPAYAKQVATSIDRHGLGQRVELLGHVEDLAAFFAEIDVLVVPSTGHEGQPTVILEALAAGVPVIVRRPVWSPDFDALPVAAYATGDELGDALRRRPEPARADELRRRFGPDQALEALLAAGTQR